MIAQIDAGTDEAAKKIRALQSRASDPQAFVWVAANAGSGKTHVLVERLMRILLDGTPPSRILCLTFTNAAAAEMANRLFTRLAEWAIIKSDDDLAEQILELTGEAPDEAKLTRARILFPIVLESPGGLKIHTIHAFCERLLHRFPLEALVSPHFSVMDERSQHELIATAREEVMRDIADMKSDDALFEALSIVSSFNHDIKLDELLAHMISKRDQIMALDLLDKQKREAVFSWLAAMLEVSPHDSTKTLIEDTFSESGFDQNFIKHAGDVLNGGKTKQDVTTAKRLYNLANAKSPTERYRFHRELTLTTTGTVFVKLMSKGLRTTQPQIAKWIDDELTRAEQVSKQLAGITTLTATRATLLIATAVINSYQIMKLARGLLDYDDLISRTRSLLTNSEDAAWVLYKLDGGIDHILVDEAQDTSREQWQIIQCLAVDMLSGQTAGSERGRSAFAVGDEKQSIFSFQGADPAMFTKMRDFFEKRTREAGHEWRHLQLETSFRSAPEILRAVDLVFGDETLACCLSDEGAQTHHIAFHNMPGRVEVWSTLTHDTPEIPNDPWTVPLDYVPASDPKIKLAGLIAKEISDWLTTSRMLEAEGRPITPGDILILVRRRSQFAEALIRELKLKNVPVAGIDRMKLNKQMIVEDLIALSRFVLLPEDDLSLAALMKSPLVGLDEDDLFTLAHDRTTSLWASLQAQARHSNKFRRACDLISGWLAAADRSSPFEFYAAILSQVDIRRQVLVRLGPEAADPMAEFLNAALEFERRNVPSLEAFISWLTHSDVAIKRDMDLEHDKVRIMTIHGAKGLEANIVILPDTCQVPPRSSQLVDISIPGGAKTTDMILPVWSISGASNIIKPLAQAKEQHAQHQQEEYIRLLYVAMTRARCWLIITGYETRNKRPDNCWYSLIRSNLEPHLEPMDEFDIHPRWTLKTDDRTASQTLNAPVSCTSPLPNVSPPNWLFAAAPIITTSQRRLVPSRSDDEPEEAPTLAGPSAHILGARQLSRGLLMHSLLEYLPKFSPETWLDRALDYLSVASPEFDAVRHRLYAEQAIKVLSLPEMRPFLSEHARSEVALSAQIITTIGTPIQVEGRVDRLVIIDKTVHVLDFKSHRQPPSKTNDVPSGILRQMALYRAALGEIFTEHSIQASVLWTETSHFMELDDELLNAAFYQTVRAPGKTSG